MSTIETEAAVGGGTDLVPTQDPALAGFPAGGADLDPGKGRRRRGKATTVNAAKPRFSLSEYSQYRELFWNLTLRELRSKYKRSVIGWGWSMINPLANMAIYTIVFSMLFRIHPPVGVPSGLNSYALMYLCGMLPWTLWQGSIMESMGALLGNQNLIQKTYFPRELIPGATVASKLVSHFIEMSLLVTVIVAFGNWRALPMIPFVLLTIALVTIFATGMSLIFSLGNVFYRDIMHFANILFFIWMFLTPVTYPWYLVGGGLEPTGSPGPSYLVAPRALHLLGHTFSLGSLFKANPMTDAVLSFQSFIYNGALPSTGHYLAYIPLVNGTPGKLTHGVVPAVVSWGDYAYLAAWAIGIFVIGMWIFRKYEARLPEEL
ncbi:MAG TPA: ABC transporter permease [Acidimicrobiales bacterium]|nr:ABC transporter permease [Acidimicrobiales bacterium]